MTQLTLHATSVTIGGVAVLFEGPSGIGKSDLALRLIDRGATLVSDDYTRLHRDGDRLIASVPPNVAGRIEVRGLGIVEMPHVPAAPVALLVTLCDTVERMPEPASRALFDLACPTMMLDARPASAALKVELAMRTLSIELGRAG
ncbi:HPr kinase/phosphorylase [Sphingomonas gellani]|uniref:HPr kinase/phosphorylase n=1 Tax=Sphingomonas gellani TaxID=1166340 RepID=UPI001BAF855D|nr:aldolase [Sphingomonas gellani]